MIDIHSHIIPNVDDGSKSIDETVKLIKEAVDAGFTDVILTSHYIPQGYETDAKELTIWREKLQDAITKENISLNLHTGMEVYITEEIVDRLEQGKLLTLANSKYLLMELPLNTKVQYLSDIIFRLINKNIVPIIAHPERYSIVQKDPSIVKSWINQGCMLQCNFGSILGLYGKTAKKTIKYLLKNDLVHFFGTDVHKKETIYIKVQTATKKIKKIVGADKLEELTNTNARYILEKN